MASSVREMFYCCKTFEEREKIRIHREIEERLRLDKRESMRFFKLLLLGTGESGKSTFIKQMRIIHGVGYNEEDRKEFTKFIHQNILQSMQAMIEAMVTMQIDFSHERPLIHQIKMTDSRVSFHLSSGQFKTIARLWSTCQGIQEAYRRRNEFQLSDSTFYFMSRLKVISKSNYIPTLEDVLHVRIPTTGVVEHSFLIKSITFQMIDVSGQRSERRKWLHVFDDVTSVIFLTSLSEYDQKLYECEEVNRLEESLQLYKSIINNLWFERSSIILFLNKIDLLQEKVEYSNLADYFPSFKGPKKCALAAQNFILEIFSEANKMNFRPVYSHFTCATDTQNCEIVFAAVKDTILDKYLKDFHIIP